ncbi:MAG: type I-E CRISPR-associated protein Cse2/CasB [Gemmatimonadaceae bacterium]
MTEAPVTPGPVLGGTARSEGLSGGEPPPLRQRIARVAAYVGRDDLLSRGDRAALRRLDGDSRDIPPAVFWRICYQFDIEPPEESFWMTALPLMATHRHNPQQRAGRTLAAAGVSASRLERWLRLRKDSARREARRLLARLGDGGIDWGEFGALLYRWDDNGRRSLARAFFRSPEFRQAPTSEGGNQ